MVQQLPNPISKQLPLSLEAMVVNIEIHPNFSICHPDYRAYALPAETVNRFEEFSAELKHKYLGLLIRNFIYGIYYNGYLRSSLSLQSDLVSLASHQNLENNRSLGIDRDFFERLHASNCSIGHSDPGWQVLLQKPDGTLAVTKGGLTLHVENNVHLQPGVEFAAAGNFVDIRMPKNRVQNGFYVAVSNSGQERQHHRDDCPGTARIYFHLTPEGAVAVMQALTQQLNDAAIPFTFKVLYNPAEYVRYDSGVLYFECQHYEVVREALKEIYRANQSHFRESIPLFTKMLAPGVSVAEEPNSKFAERESFGMNRCRIVASSLLEAWQNGNNSPAERMDAIRQNFSRLGIELLRPYLNANSADIYEPL